MRGSEKFRRGIWGWDGGGGGGVQVQSFVTVIGDE